MRRDDLLIATTTFDSEHEHRPLFIHCRQAQSSNPWALCLDFVGRFVGTKVLSCDELGCMTVSTTINHDALSSVFRR